MDSGTLQRWQAARLFKTLQPHVGFLYRLRERMQQVGFLPSDPLYKRVCTAYESLQARCSWICTTSHAKEPGGRQGNNSWDLSCRRDS
jgi:hypothetical protein